MKAELEKMIIEWSSIPLAIIICGSIAPNVREPLKEAMSKMYKGAKTAGKEIRRLLYGGNPLLY